MIVKELIELNWNIGDLIIEVRDEKLKLINVLHIGAGVGKKPQYYTDKDVFILKDINSWDKDHLWLKLLINQIPKKWLEYEVTRWECLEAYRDDEPLTSMEKIKIVVKEYVPGTAPAEKNLKGQISLF